MPIPPLTSISTHAPSAVAPGNGLLEQMFMLPGLRTLAAGSGEAAATMQAIALDLFVIFGSAAIAAILLKRLRIAVIPGYFLAGMLVGPGGMGLVMEGETLEMISFFAVILLLFGIGMHLDLDLLKREMGPMLIAGVGSCALTASVGFGVCVLLGISAPAALAIGMAFSLSSTAVVMRIIAQRRDLRRPHGRLALAILIIQDLAVIVMLALLPLLATWGTTRAVEDAAAATVPGQVEVTTEERAAADARSAGNVETGAAATSPANSLADATAAPTEATRQATAGGAVPHLPGVPVPSHTTGDAAAAAIGSGESGASDAIVRPRIGRLAGAVDGEEEDTVPEAARRMAIKIAGAAVILALGLIVLPRVVEEAASGGAPEVLTIVGLAVAIGAAAATKWLGFSAELGAFVGGLLLSTSPFRHQLAGSLSTLRDIFLAVFFVSIGMRLDLAMLIENWWILILGGLFVCIVKTVVIGAFAWGVGAGVGTAAIVGLSLAQAGEFTIVFVQASERAGVVNEEMAAFSIAIVVITLFITPGLIGLAYRIGPQLDARYRHLAPWIKRVSPGDDVSPTTAAAAAAAAAGAGAGSTPTPTGQLQQQDVDAEAARDSESPVGEDSAIGGRDQPASRSASAHDDEHGMAPAESVRLSDATDERAELTPIGGIAAARHAIVAGYGTIGRSVVDELERLGVHCVVIELNAFTVRSERRRGRTMIYGDVSDPEVLESADVEHARGLFITIPDDDAAVRACRVARELHRPLFIAARTHFPGPGDRAREAGADHVSVDEEVSAGDMRRAVRQCWGRREPSSIRSEEPSYDGGDAGHG